MIFRKGRPELSTIVVIDVVQGPWGEDRPFYWRAQVPTADMVKLNPRNYGMYKRSRSKGRLLVWVSAPLVAALMVGSIIFATASAATMSAAISMAVMGAVVAGALFGLPIARLVVGMALQMEYLYVMGRIRAPDAELLGVTIGESTFACIPVNPPPMLTGDEDDAKTLVSETGMTLWRLDALGRGVDGWSTNNFIEVSIANKREKNGRKGSDGDVMPAINIDRAPGPDQSVSRLPGGR